jgi:hypothetical protein
VRGSWPPGVTKPPRMSLAQFSKDLVASDSQGRPDCAGGIGEEVDQESIGHQRFAAEVVAAMSIPAVKFNGEVKELPKTATHRREEQGPAEIKF